MKSRKYLTPLTKLTGKGSQRSECTNSNVFIAWEVDWIKGSLWLLANWHETQKSQESIEVKNKHKVFYLQ